MADHRDQPYPRPSRPASPTGSICSTTSKASTHSRLQGAPKSLKTKVKPKKARGNFITEGLIQVVQEGQMSSFIQEVKGEGEVIPSSQENEREVTGVSSVAQEIEELVVEEEDEDEVSNDGEEDDGRIPIEKRYEDEDLWTDFPTPPVALMTTPLLTVNTEASSQQTSMYGIPTPSPALLDHPALKNARTPPLTHEVLPDLDKTPTSPRIRQITEAEAYALKVRAAKNNEGNQIMTGNEMLHSQFEDKVNQAKEYLGDFEDEEIRSSTPDLPSEEWTITEDQRDNLRENFDEIFRGLSRVTPHMITNREVITKDIVYFIGKVLNSEWANTKVDGEVLASIIKQSAKKVSFELPAPQQIVPTPMEVDPSPARIPAKAKGKGKATIPPTPPQHPVVISLTVTSPIKVSKVPKPIMQHAPKIGVPKGKPISSYNPIQLPVVSKWGATNKTQVGVTPHIPESGTGQHVMGRDASGSNAPSMSAVPAARGQQIDTSRSHALQNPPVSSKVPQGKIGDTTTDNYKRIPPPVPYHSRVAALAKSTAGNRNSRAPQAHAPLSYAQAAKKPVAPTATAETIQWAVELKKQCPELSIGDALKHVASIVNTPPSSDEVAPRQTCKVLAAQKAAQGITGGLNRKSAQFGYLHIVQPENFSDMGKIVDAMNRHLVYNRSQMRVQNGRLFKNVVHFYLNLVPSKQGFTLIREALFKAMEKDVPEGDEHLPSPPQLVAHLILKGFDYYTSRYNKRPEDILTGKQVLQSMQSVDQFRGLECVKTPSVVRSRGSNDMAVAFVDVWDTKSGSRTHNLVNKVYHIRGKLIRVEYAHQREFVPQCQRCWRWNHGTSRCRLSHELCTQCGQPHMTRNHNSFATCCGAARKKEDWDGECKHEVKCINCKGNHTADSSKCTYKQHQNNISWHEQRRAADMQAEKEKRNRRRETVQQVINLGEGRIIEIPSSSE